MAYAYSLGPYQGCGCIISQQRHSTNSPDAILEQQRDMNLPEQIGGHMARVSSVMTTFGDIEFTVHCTLDTHKARHHNW